jgi:hypothetical protein
MMMIIKNLNVFKNILLGLSECIIRIEINTFCFKRMKKTFSYSIIKTIASATHPAGNSFFL